MYLAFLLCCLLKANVDFLQVPHEKPEEFADVVFAALGHGLKARL